MEPALRLAAMLIKVGSGSVSGTDRPPAAGHTTASGTCNDTTGGPVGLVRPLLSAGGSRRGVSSGERLVNLTGALRLPFWWSSLNHHPGDSSSSESRSDG
jgi:hypothetical protein